MEVLTAILSVVLPLALAIGSIMLMVWPKLPDWREASKQPQQPEPTPTNYEILDIEAARKRPCLLYTSDAADD